MSEISNLSVKLKIDDWLQKCVKYLTGTAYDVVSGNTELLNFSTSKTTIIPPIPDYNKIMKSKGQRPFLGPADSEVLKKDRNIRACTRGFVTETSVSKYFDRFGPGGIYISDLKILELIRGYRKETDLQPFLPDVKRVHEFLKKKENSSIQIDGILIHPKIGIAVIEIKSVEYSKETSEQHHNRLPQIIFGEDGVKKQLNNFEKFVNGLFEVIFGKKIPFPVHKIACAPNADTGQSSVEENIYLLDKKAFNKNSENFKHFWNKMMTLETKIPSTEFIQFAAVLITLKTAFGFVSTFNCNIISTSFDFLNENKMLLDDIARKQQTQIREQNKVVYFWLNSEQLGVYECNAGKHFVMGPPGSGKTLLIKVRILKFKERSARIFCPHSLTFQYQQFIRDNDLQNKVEVLNFSELINIGKLLEKCETEGTDFHDSRYGYFLSPDISIYCDEMDSKTCKTMNILQLFEFRPDDAETFVVRESPDTLINRIFELTDAFLNIGYLTTSLKTMMRSSIEIIEYFLKWNQIASHHNIRAGHSLKFKDVLTISYNDKNEAIQIIINYITIKKDVYKYSDMAVITLKYRTGDIKNALNNSNIPTKHIEEDADTPAITILTPFQSKSYEWKMVIVWVNLKHEQALTLAVTRASIELIILQQDIFDNFQAQLYLGVSYAEEQGVLQSDEEAIKGYKKAAEQFNAQAQYCLGVIYDQGKGVLQSHKEAAKWYRKAAEQGNAPAQSRLGVIHATGHGVPQSNKEAVKWYRKAAEQGHAQAQYNLGMSYGKGQGVRQSYDDAVKWYRKAAEQGHAQAQYNLGISYGEGQGVRQSNEKAYKWYRKAAKQGHAQAQYNLGVYYAKGQGVRQSYEDAVKWLRRAAEQDHAQAQYNLGIHYGEGQDVRQSNEEAVTWLRRAAEQGDVDALYSLAVMYAIDQNNQQSDEESVEW